MKKKKTVMAVTAAAVMAGSMAIGTFAWQSLNQMAKNEKVSTTAPGARLHDDFNGQKKAVYVENYTTPEEGTAVYARVRLDEYMEIGEDAGENLSGESRDVTVLVEGTEIGDVTTWRTHKPDTEEDSDPFHEYWSWNMGGSTIYMPTFNKNMDSLAADINGTYAGTLTEPEINVLDDESPAVTREPYEDYHEYTNGEKKTADAYYDADGNSEDEGQGTGLGNGGEEGVNYRTEKDEEHTAKRTATANIISMEEWMEKGSPVGNYWVWDEDGWYYWALPVNPGQTTGCLLNAIEQTKYGEKIYYGINAVGQFATAGDWGSAGEGGTGGSGFYADGNTVSENAKKLLEVIQALITGEDGAFYKNCGSNTYRRVEDNGVMSELICAGEDMKIGNDDDRDAVIDLSEEYPDGFEFNGKNYGTLFLKADGGSTIYYSVGTDKNLGTSDDDKLWYVGTQPFPNEEDKLSDVGADAVTVQANGQKTTIWANQTLHFTANVTLRGESIKNQKVTWKVTGGEKGTTIDANGDLKVSEDEKDGAILEITAVSQEDNRAKSATYTLTVEGPDSIEIRGNSESLPGKQMTFNASVKKGNQVYTSQKVQWSVSGGRNTTSIDKDTGVLTIDSNETQGTVLTVTAVSVNDSTVKASTTLRIHIVNEGEILTIDNVEFYVLKIVNNQALIITKMAINQRFEFGANGIWRDSEIRSYLNNTAAGIIRNGWLYKKTNLNNCLIQTTIYTQATIGSSQYIETSDKVFILSEEDVFGTSNGIRTSGITQAYTAGEKLDVSKTGGSWVPYYISNPSALMQTYLRSPAGEGVAYIDIDGTYKTAPPKEGNDMTASRECGFAFRPAMWIDLARLN